jgi:hypothetical protein
MRLLIAPIFGAALFVFGIALLIGHVVAWRRQKHDPTLNEGELRHYRSRFRRRMQTSGTIALIGFLIPLEAMIPKANPILFTLYCALVLMLAMWIILLGIADYIATRAHIRASLSRLGGARLALEKRLAEMRSRGSNGHFDDD